jgi:predicted transcriptional regulator
MARQADDKGLETLLALDGVVLVIDPMAGHWVKFVVQRVDPSDARPHGISYSLSLHSADGERLVGFDNAHAVARRRGPSGRSSAAHDHRHRGGAAAVYEFHDATTLLSDLARGRCRAAGAGSDRMKVLRIGIASYDEMKARTLAIAQGELKPRRDEPKLWFTSFESLARVLSDKNRALLDLIIERRPRSLAELESLSGRAKSNLSRTLKSMARFGLVELHEGEGGVLQPRVPYDEIQLDLPVGRSRRKSHEIGSIGRS